MTKTRTASAMPIDRSARTTWRRWSSAVILVAAVASAGSPVRAQVDAPIGPELPYATGHVLVELRPGVTIEPRPDADGWRVRDPAGVTDAGMRRALEGTLATLGVLAVEPALRVRPARPDLAAAVGLDRHHRVYLPDGADVDASLATLAGHGGLVANVEPDGLGGVADLVPDDPFFGLQYALQNIGQTINGWTGVAGADISATAGWDMTTGSDAVVIAVLDSGVNTHVELAGRMLPGWNAVLGNDDTSDSCASHGTHVTGIACANADNSLGIAGVNWNAMVLPVRILNGCSGLESDLANGITWAVDHGADVLNMSLQYGVGTSFLRDAVQYADAQGVIQVAASGNNGFSGGVAYPGRWPETITSAATNNRDLRAAFSNFGPEVDIAAPGEDVYSLSGTTSYAYRDGTSMAAPHVSGLVGLMLALDPSLGPDEVRSILEQTADDLGQPCFDQLTGWGRINMEAALALVMEGLPATGDVNGDGMIDVDDLIALLLAWGPCAECSCPADLDGSGTIDVDDLVTLIMSWG